MEIEEKTQRRVAYSAVGIPCACVNVSLYLDHDLVGQLVLVSGVW